jgi:ferrous iron transport protein B
MAGNVLFMIYITGALIGIVAAKFLKMTAFKGVEEPFVMEMPKYRLPSVKLIWHTVLTKTMMYLKKAGTYIAGASMLIWFLSNYPHNQTLEEVYGVQIANATSQEQKVSLQNDLASDLLEQSYLGTIGKFSEPLFTPLGFDWKMSVALQTGLAAKEVVVSTLGVLYALGSDVDAQSNSLVGAISKNISFPSAVAFIVVIMIYLPCLAAAVVFTREAGGIRYFFYLLAFTSIVAYGLAFIAYNVTKILV